MTVRSPIVTRRRAVLGGSAALATGVAAGRAFAKGGALTSDQCDALAKTLADAPSHGFRRNEFVTPDLADAIRSGALQGAGVQAKLKTAILAYARAQRGGRLGADQFLEDWSVRPAPYDPAAEFSAAVAADRLQPWLDSLPPRYQGYAALRKSLATYRAVSAKGNWDTVAGSDAPFTVGASDPRVPALRRRLAAEDTSVQVDADPPDVFDPALQQAVQRFQLRYGLKADGMVGGPTLEALNVPVGGRILQIEANMERWRWLPRELPATRIQVNIAAAVLAVYRGGEPVLAMKAVAGRPEDQTPMLQSAVSSIVLNPPWHVPDSIAKKEIWPKAHADKGYLARNQYQVIEGRLVQRAGPKSALGRFKFDFQNPFGVYLHDTPAQAGFGRASRLASHGCVRLEQPKALADLLLDDNSAWPPARIDTAVHGEETQRVALSQNIPVYILYWTVFVDNSGQTQFRADAYDWDQKLIDLLGAARSRDSDPVDLTA